MTIAEAFPKPAAAGGRWVNIDPDLRFADPRPLALLDYWQGKRDCRVMPSRADIDPLEIPAHLPNLMLIEVARDPLRLRYRLIGTAIAEIMGRDSTGCYYDDIYEPDLLASIYDSFRWIIAEQRPLRTYGEAFYPDKNCYWYEIVNLPLSSEGAQVDMVLGELLFHGADVPCEGFTRARVPGD